MCLHIQLLVGALFHIGAPNAIAQVITKCEDSWKIELIINQDVEFTLGLNYVTGLCFDAE